MHLHPDITIAIVDREHRARVAASRPCPPCALPALAPRRTRLGTAVVRFGARLGRLDVIVVAGRRWRGRAVAM
jgi:hypothetical protein